MRVQPLTASTDTVIDSCRCRDEVLSAKSWPFVQSFWLSTVDMAAFGLQDYEGSEEQKCGQQHQYDDHQFVGSASFTE
jgi:hypothetical protein